jgi:hypothetical protein
MQANEPLDCRNLAIPLLIKPKRVGVSEHASIAFHRRDKRCRKAFFEPRKPHITGQEYSSGHDNQNLCPSGYASILSNDNSDNKDGHHGCKKILFPPQCDLAK